MENKMYKLSNGSWRSNFYLTSNGCLVNGIKLNWFQKILWKILGVKIEEDNEDSE